MRRLSRRHPAWGLLVGVVFCLGSRVPAAEPEKVKFDTYDYVEIHGAFYASDKGNKAPCAILLHALGGSTDQEGWKDLAAKLQGKGFAVLTFDFRGHGDSTNVGPAFWRIPTNQSLKSYRPAKLREQISYKDYGSLYAFASMVNDIAAAKHFLDRKNDSGECNSSNVVVIGAETGGTLGAMWIASEWRRRQITPGFALAGAASGRNTMEGQDIASAVYLSISPKLGLPPRLDSVPVANWLRSPVREKVPMYFLFGEQDQKAAQYAKYLADDVLHAEKDKQLKLTGKMAIKDTKLSGKELLGKPSLNTEDLIIRYVTKVVEDRGTNPWAKRDADRTPLLPVPVQVYLR